MTMPSSARKVRKHAVSLLCGVPFLGLILAAAPGAAQDRFSQSTGREVYNAVCRACHMDEGQGAEGAGKYPALAKNPNLEASGYPVTLVLNGQKAMPPLGRFLSDKQVADVVNYVRSSFGNSFPDPVSAADVETMRDALGTPKAPVH
jgi:mono/diheme cytochrome c family protein